MAPPFLSHAARVLGFRRALSLVGVAVLIARLSNGRLAPRPGVFALLVGPLLVPAAIHVFVEVQPRYHLAFVPNLALFAGSGAGFLKRSATRTAAAEGRVRGETPP